MKKLRRFLSAFAAAALIAAACGFYALKIPTSFYCYPNENPAEEPLYTLEPLTSSEEEHYIAKVKLFGLLPIKDANVYQIAQKQLTVSGAPFGVKLYTKGCVVVDTVEGSPAVAAGIQTGDVILSYNGSEIGGNEELAAEVQASEGKKQQVIFQRNARRQTAWVTPAPNGEGGYTIGLWVRDSAAGLGTLTYYDPESGILAGLGHPITDADTGQTLPVEEGTLVSAVVTGVKAGEKGVPGELLGYLQKKEIGTLVANRKEGVFAIAAEAPDGPTYPIALKNEVRAGPAEILCTVSGDQPRAFRVEITAINNNLMEERNLSITVTDPELLKKTGGIVHGMSGSPILQGGKLVGAITHVLVEEPEKGYGILIENMLAAG